MPHEFLQKFVKTVNNAVGRRILPIYYVCCGEQPENIIRLRKDITSDLRMYNSENHTAIGVARNANDETVYGNDAVGYTYAPITARYSPTVATVATDDVNTLNCSTTSDNIYVGGTGGTGNISVNTSNVYRALAHAANIVGHVHNDFDDGHWINF